MTGGTVEKELIMQIIVESFSAVNSRAYTNLTLEVKRGDKRDKQSMQVEIPSGDSLTLIDQMFNQTSKFYMVKDTGVF